MAEESDWAFKYEDNGSVWNNLHSCFPLVPSVKQQAALTRQAGLRPNQGQHKLTVMLDAPYFPSLQGVKEPIDLKGWELKKTPQTESISRFGLRRLFIFIPFPKGPLSSLKEGPRTFTR